MMVLWARICVYETDSVISTGDVYWDWVSESLVCYCKHFFFQAEVGIRVAQESRGLGGVYKGQ